MQIIINIFRLTFIALFPVVASIILYLLDKKTNFAKLENRVKQTIYAIVFGGLAIVGTEFSVDVGGIGANVRDASVLTAGLFFGAPAGIIAGVIGGVERFFAVYWGAGEYTKIACSLSTIICGVFGAVLKKFMFDNKKPSILYALAIGLVAEVMHMLMVFITHMTDIADAFVLIRNCAFPMIAANGISVMLSALAISLLSKEKRNRKSERRQIATLAQRWLLICMLSGFLITCSFTAVLQMQLANKNSDDILRLNIEDVVVEISDASDRNLLELTNKAAEEYKNGENIDDIATKYNIADLSIINNEGIIVESIEEKYIDYNMAEGDQSAEFLVLLNGQTSFVQKYQPISLDNNVYRKYAGVVLPSGGFIQVGYDAKNFQADIDREVKNVASHRHIGQKGYILIVDTDLNIVSTRQDKLNETTRQDIKIDENIKEGQRYTANIYGDEVYTMFQMTEGYYILGVIPKEEAVFSRSLSVYMTMFLEIVLFGGLFILIYFLIKKLVVDNIKSVNNSLGEISGGNLNVTVNVRSNEEFASLSDDINATVETLKQYIKEAAARIDRELELAKVIQESSLPSVFPPFPERKDIDIFASMNAAKEVGGDFYDFYILEDGRLAFLVADVSGKGITGAMFMMKAKTLIKSFAQQSTSAADILTKTNSALCEGNDAEMFVTCFMGILDTKNEKIEFANAGHNPPLIRRKDGSFEYFKCRSGFVLAGMEGVCYKPGEIDFHSGDAIFLYTDGVTEAINIDNVLYGEERLHQVLCDTKNKSSKDICDSVKAGLNDFVKEAPQFDDITILCIQTNALTQEDVI